MKLQQLIGAEGQSSVCPAVVVAEFDFVDTGGESFNHRAGLANRPWQTTSSGNATTDSSRGRAWIISTSAYRPDHGYPRSARTSPRRPDRQ